MKDNTTGPGLRRREFFKLLGGGIFIYFGTRDPSELLAMPLLQRRERSTDYNAFLRIAEDGTVSCFTGKIEMGQGPITSLAQQIADELDVPYESVKMVMGDTALCPYDMGTWGSLTTREFSPALRAAGAEAKAVLLELGAEYLELDRDDVKAAGGVISGISDPGKTVTYGQLAKGQRIERFLDEKPDPIDHTQFHYVGQPMLHDDGRLKVTGKAAFTGDMKLPDMVYARILRPPSHSAQLVSADTSEAEKIEGVQVVGDGDLVAVLHELRDTADRAITLVKGEYTIDEIDVDEHSIFDYLMKSPNSGREVDSAGDLGQGEGMADMILESEFNDGYVSHATIEPHAALAHFENDRITVWAATQSPFGAQESIAGELGMELEQVRVIAPFVGGGFGGKAPHQQAVEAARLSRLSGKPVMLIWTREEEFFYDSFRPAAVVKIRSGVTSSGKITMWDFNQYYAGTRGSDTIYNVPHRRTMGYDAQRGSRVHPFNTGAWRAPANNTNTFSRESHIDRMAVASKTDPLQFRLDNLDDKRMIDVWKAVADRFGYSPAAGPTGRGIGLACGTDAGSYVAHMARVEVNEATGEVKVVRVVCAQDMGLCVNPQGAKIQMEGCITMGLGYALTEDISFRGGDVITRNFDTYQIPLFSWVPEIETVILDRQDQPAYGGGEPAIICMGAVIANAIFDACGARLFRMPMTPERVLEAVGNSQA